MVSGEAVMTSLSGGAQRILLQMIEEVAIHVSDSKQHINTLRGLVEQVMCHSTGGHMILK